MTDRHDSDAFDDIDDLLRSAAHARPSAEVEEELLLRMKDELAAAKEQRLALEPVPLEPPLDGDQARGRPVVRVLVAAAAVVAVGIAALVIGTTETTDVDTTETPTTTVPAEPGPDLTALVAACAEHLPVLAAIELDSVPSNVARDGPFAALDLFEATATAAADLRDALEATTDGAFDDLRSQADELVDLTEAQLQRYENQQIPSGPAVVDAVARRIERFANDLAIAADLTACETPAVE